MPITDEQAVELKKNISRWIEEIMPLSGERPSPDPVQSKTLIIDSIQQKLQQWCEENQSPILTLQSLQKEKPAALPSGVKDLGGIRCDILMAYLACHSQPGSSSETLAATDSCLRKSILVDMYNKLADYSFLDPLMRRRCKRIIKMARDFDEITVQEAVVINLGSGCPEETKQQTEHMLLKLQQDDPSFYRLAVIDNLYSRLRQKLNKERRKSIHAEPATLHRLENAVEFMAHWRNNPVSECPVMLSSFYSSQYVQEAPVAISMPASSSSVG